MATRNYHFCVTSTTTGDNKANIRIVNKGVITAILFEIVGLGGATITGQQAFEISKMSSSAFTQNDCPPTLIARFVGSSAINNSAAFDRSTLLAGLANPVAQGDFIYLHQLVTSTAPANQSIYATLVVQE